MSTLVVGERIVSECSNGLLEAEYALFDRDDVVLSREGREKGYLTSAELARHRLGEARITASLAHDSFSALRAGHRRALSSTRCVLDVVEQLGPCEAFEGFSFSVATGRYAGTWLDLDALAAACPLRGTAMILQALHLVLVLEEVADDAPVRLLTSGVTESCPLLERTWCKPELDAARRLPNVLRQMRVPPKSPTPRDDDELRGRLLRTLRERMTASAKARPRLRRLVTLLAGTAPDTVPVIAPPDSGHVIEQLRRHRHLLRGDDHLRAVAQFLSIQAERIGALPDVALLAARAWLAAGEAAHARHFAERLRDASDTAMSVRLMAIEILDATGAVTVVPPPPASAPSVPFLLTRVRERPTEPRIRWTGPTGPVDTLLLPARIESDPSAASEPHIVVPPERATEPRLPVAPRLPASPAVPERSPGPEIVESLALPYGASEEMLEERATPGDPLLARIAMTRLARALGRDYRLWYGTMIETDLFAIDGMQRHLRRRFVDAGAGAKQRLELEAELTRHGALLSEILARSLGSEWDDLSSEDPREWTMVVPPGIVVQPIGRVHRFFSKGHQEPDLVAFYTDLQSDQAAQA
ncbi:MAG TPA: hypothetical protein VF765_36420 [Polyangiaceae bacterium]